MASWASFDALRERNPTLGFAAYAIEPAGPVTLEVYAFGQVGTFTGPSLTSCILKAFPDKRTANNELTPLPVPKPPAADIDLDIPEFLRRTPAPPIAPDPINVFD